MDNKGSENLLQTICMGFIAILSLFIGVWIGNLLLGAIIAIGIAILCSILSICIILIKDKIDKSKESNKNVDIVDK